VYLLAYVDGVNGINFLGECKCEKENAEINLQATRKIRSTYK
jgi:hypothetical protein